MPVAVAGIDEGRRAAEPPAVHAATPAAGTGDSRAKTSCREYTRRGFKKPLISALIAFCTPTAYELTSPGHARLQAVLDHVQSSRPTPHCRLHGTLWAPISDRRSPAQNLLRPVSEALTLVNAMTPPTFNYHLLSHEIVRQRWQSA